MSDSNSPYDGQTIPNLNGDGRFMRGSSISGTEQGDAFQGHWHALQYDGLHTDWQSWTDYGQIRGNNGAGEGMRATDPSTMSGYGTPRIETETRPINMSVVWIMRVK